MQVSIYMQFELCRGCVFYLRNRLCNLGVCAITLTLLALKYPFPLLPAAPVDAAAAPVEVSSDGVISQSSELQIYESFDAMGLRDELLRGIYGESGSVYAV